MTKSKKNHMPRIVKIEHYDYVWPLSWKLLTKKKREIEVTYKVGVLTATYKGATIPFFKKEFPMGTGRPLKFNTVEMLEITGFKCGSSNLNN